MIIHSLKQLANEGLFNYLEGYRQLFLPYKTNNGWLKTNTKAYIVEAKSDLAEARQLQDAAEDKSKYSVGVLRQNYCR